MSAQDDDNPVISALQNTIARLIVAIGRLGVLGFTVVGILLIAMVAIVLIWGFLDIPGKGHIFANIVQNLLSSLTTGIGYTLVVILIVLGIIVLMMFLLHNNDDRGPKKGRESVSSPLRISESASPHGLNPPAPIEARVRNADEDVTVVSPKRPIGQR